VHIVFCDTKNIVMCKLGNVVDGNTDCLLKLLIDKFYNESGYSTTRCFYRKKSM
jgi:hypothetical protein